MDGGGEGVRPFALRQVVLHHKVGARVGEEGADRLGGLFLPGAVGQLERHDPNGVVEAPGPQAVDQFGMGPQAKDRRGVGRKFSFPVGMHGAPGEDLRDSKIAHGSAVHHGVKALAGKQPTQGSVQVRKRFVGFLARGRGGAGRSAGAKEHHLMAAPGHARGYRGSGQPRARVGDHPDPVDGLGRAAARDQDLQSRGGLCKAGLYGCHDVRRLGEAAVARFAACRPALAHGDDANAPPLELLD